jgi:chemotaxis protein methyltransferase CheR
MIESPAAASSVDRFRALIARRLGLHFDAGRLAWLADVLRRHAAHAQLTEDAYLVQLENDTAGRSNGALAEDLTVPETYFFRHIEQFHALQEQVLPARLRARAATRSLRILSAGCASGEEAYSIAMALHGRLPDAGWSLSIEAIDVNPAMLAKARRARYTAWSLRETPASVQARWFRPEGRELVLDPTIRNAVHFEQRNLHVDDPLFWRPGSFDVVFCRNVLMYFTPENASAAVNRIASAMAPGGVLFLGHAETLRALSNDFHLLHHHGTFCYQRKGEAGEAEAGRDMPAAGARDASGRAEPEPTGDWAGSIARAAERVRSLTTPAAPSAARAHTAASRVSDHLEPALDMLRHERFADALALLRALPAAAQHDPDVLLLRAMLLVHSGDWQAAEETGQRLLALDGFHAGAHYVLALCREGAGDHAGAIDRHQRAIQLDPSFAMPRLHLGLLARRAGDGRTMRRELNHALTLLQREAAPRLLLFGGGFDRRALVDLCRAEIRAAEAMP